MTRIEKQSHENGQVTSSGDANVNKTGSKGLFWPRTRVQRAAVVVLSLACVGAIALVTRSLLALANETEPPLRVDFPKGQLHSRPLIERDGRRLLWARGRGQVPDMEWFDVTQSKIDPELFQHGIGKDTIASIDAPQFMDADDPRLGEYGFGDDTYVLGFVHEGDARAYPLWFLDRHELVNDTVGGKPVTVGW